MGWDCGNICANQKFQLLLNEAGLIWSQQDREVFIVHMNLSISLYFLNNYIPNDRKIVSEVFRII